MNGIVVGLQARMTIIVYSPNGAELEIECVVDTGFEGFLTLPPTVVAELELPYVAPIDANLADNSRHQYSSGCDPLEWSGAGGSSFSDGSPSFARHSTFSRPSSWD
jgi:hypothetical protein